jgi:hypothetical protein
MHFLYDLIKLKFHVGSHILSCTVSHSEVTCPASFLLQTAVTESSVTTVVLNTVNGFTDTARRIHRMPWCKKCMWATPHQINTQMYEFQPEQNRIKYLKAKTQMC